MPILQPSAPQLASHLVWPFLTFTAVVLLLNLVGVDLRVADWIYYRWGAVWVWRDAWLTRDVIHDGGRMLVGTMAGILVVLSIATRLLPAGRIFRRGLSYLLVSTVCAALLINLLKELTHVDCPWDLARYGGTQPYASLFDLASWSSRSGACFPAGHASAGYAWFGLYFLALEYCPRWRWPALGFVISMGLVFGTAQLLRGAHFVSHDWWTAGLCWFVAAGFHRLFFGPKVLHLSFRGAPCWKKVHSKAEAD